MYNPYRLVIMSEMKRFIKRQDWVFWTFIVALLSLIVYIFQLQVFFPSNQPANVANTPELATSTTFILNGNVNPNGAATWVWFEYGTSTVLGNTTQDVYIGSGVDTLGFSALLPYLSPYTTYYWRSVVKNTYGSSASDIASFTTNQSSGVASSSGLTYTISGSGSPNGAPTWAWFEYGTSTVLDRTTQEQYMGSGTSTHGFSALLTNLAPHTVYYYRADAKNPNGSSHLGKILNFTTR
jgi:hypothetical protein